MTAPHADQLIAGYLARLSDAAKELPKTPRTELIEDMRSHIAEARARDSGEETDATILNMLDRLGEPSVVVADARDRLGLQPLQSYRPHPLEIAALLCLPFVWPVGVILLWISPAWNRRDKLIGSLLPPGGYLTLMVIGTRPAYGEGCGGFTDAAGVMHTTCSGGPPGWLVVVGPILLLVLVLLPLVNVVYLATRLRRSQGSPRPIAA